MRGYQKRVVFLKNTGSDVFEEAYFILREDTPKSGADDIVFEAQRIVKENTAEKEKRSRTPRTAEKLLLFGAGFFSAGLISLLIVLISL